MESPYRIMWVVVMFDLPVTEKEKLKEYQKFRKFLMQDGFMMIQYSVYARFCSSPENAEAHMSRISKNVPPEGEVRVFQMTSKQYERMKIYEGKMRKKPEKQKAQLEFF